MVEVCNSCGFPILTTKKLVSEVWDWILNQDHSSDVMTIKKPPKILFNQKECQFSLRMTMKPKLEVVEEWNTPIGSHEKIITSNREILDCLNIWYRALNKIEDLTVLDVMVRNRVIKVESTDEFCSICKKKTKVPKRKEKKRPKKVTKKLPEGEALLANEVKETTLKELEDETLKQLIATAIKERLKSGEKEKITWEDLIQLYLEENVLNTKKRHSESITEALGLSIPQVNKILRKLEEDEIIQKEFKFFDYYILSKDYNSETARKHLEILDYLKQHVDCPSTKCTQFSISLSFDLPFAIVGFILNSMNQNQLIAKESIEVPTDGVIKKVACYIPSSY